MVRVDLSCVEPPLLPGQAADFVTRCGLLCERWCDALTDFSGSGPAPRALDVGCAVGGAAFELARSFPKVVGIDFSHHFVNAANMMKAEGSMSYEAQEEGDIRVTRVARVDPAIERERVLFQQGDACNLDQR